MTRRWNEQIYYQVNRRLFTAVCGSQSGVSCRPKWWRRTTAANEFYSGDVFCGDKEGKYHVR